MYEQRLCLNYLFYSRCTYSINTVPQTQWLRCISQYWRPIHPDISPCHYSVLQSSFQCPVCIENSCQVRSSCSAREREPPHLCHYAGSWSVLCSGARVYPQETPQSPPCTHTESRSNSAKQLLGFERVRSHPEKTWFHRNLYFFHPAWWTTETKSISCISRYTQMSWMNSA